MYICILALVTILSAIYQVVQIYKLGKLRRDEVMRHLKRWQEGRSEHRSVFTVITERTKFKGIKQKWIFAGKSIDLVNGIVEMMKDNDATAEIIEEAVKQYKFLDGIRDKY